MSILVYIEADNGEIKKSSLEALVFAKKISDAKGGEVVALIADEVSNDHLSALASYGASKVLKSDNALLRTKSVSATATAVAQAADKVGASFVVMIRSTLVDAVAPRVSVKMNASVVTNVVEAPNFSNGIEVKRGVYTGKAFSTVKVAGDKVIFTIKKNAVILTEVGSGSASVESFEPSLSDTDGRVKLLEVKKQEGAILLPEAERVVSAGRGMKGPENWQMIEDLAQTLQAATACSKPVSDLDWRPHHEHVGQTGIKVSPDLYIAVGISGAIQHLAGVNSSKVIVVINKDPEAPFFKSADYGVLGDAFEVVPKLNEAIKAAR